MGRPEPWELKAQAAARREDWLRVRKDIDYTTKFHRARTDYRRRPKHIPRDSDGWEDYSER